MRRSGVFVFIAAGLLIVGAIVLWLGRSGEADSGAVAVVAAASPGGQTGDTPTLPPMHARAGEPESASLEELHPAAVVAPPEPVPASYRKALGGLTGRIVEHTPGDADTLRPVPNLKVELAGGRSTTILRPRDALLDPKLLEPEFILGSAVTDVDGRFTLEQIDPRTLGALLIDAGGPRGMFWPLEVTPVGGETSDLGDLVLPGTATLFGIIADERGAPVKGARVRTTDLGLPEAFAGVADFRAGGGVLIPAELTDGAGDRFFLPPPSLSRYESRLPFPTTYTDAAGKFELTGVPPGLVALVVDDGAHLPLVHTGVATGAAGGRRDVGTVTIGDGLPLAVKVRSTDGKELPSAQVFAGSPLPAAPVAIMKTPNHRGADGSAQFTGLVSGQAWVAARADERHDFTVLSVPEVSVGEAVITLQTPHALTLSVLDDTGAFVKGATFYGRAIKENQTPDFIFPPLALADRTQAGEDGRYVVSELDPTVWEITTVVAGHPQHRLSADLSGGDTSAEVRVARGLEAAVRVVSLSDGLPIEYALVEAFPEEDGLDINLFEGPVSCVRTDATGLARFAALPAGSVKFTVNHPGFAVTDAETTLPSKDELRIALASGGSIAGQVLDQGGPPGEPLLVMLMSPDGSGDAQLPRFVLTDLEGHFHFARVEAGSVELEARSRMEVGAGMSLFESMFNSPLAEQTTEVTDGRQTDVVLQVGAELEGTETGFVTGQLSVNGTPAEGWKIRTWGKIRRSASTDKAGRFDLGRIPAGDVNLLVSAPTQSMGNGFTDQRKITLAANEQKFVPIDLSAGAVSGRVLAKANGQPLAGVEVSAVDAEQKDGWGRRPGAVTAQDGSFTIEPVVTGKYRVRARVDGYAQASTEPFDVSAFQTKTGVVLRLPAALLVSGTVTLEGNTEKPDWIYLSATGGDGGEGRESARVEPDKLAFEFERLGPGEWEFEVATSLDTEYEPVKVTLTSDMKNLPLVFKPQTEVPAADNNGKAVFTYELK